MMGRGTSRHSSFLIHFPLPSPPSPILRIGDEQGAINQGYILLPRGIEILMGQLGLDAKMDREKLTRTCNEIHSEIGQLGRSLHSDQHRSLLLKDALCPAALDPLALMNDEVYTKIIQEVARFRDGGSKRSFHPQSDSSEKEHQHCILRQIRSHFADSYVPYRASYLQALVSKNPEPLIPGEKLQAMDKSLEDLTHIAWRGKGIGWPHPRISVPAIVTATLRPLEGSSLALECDSKKDSVWDCLKRGERVQMRFSKDILARVKASHRFLNDLLASFDMALKEDEDRWRLQEGQRSRLFASMEHVESLVEKYLYHQETLWKPREGQYPAFDRVIETHNKLIKGESLHDFLSTLSLIWETLLGRTLLLLPPTTPQFSNSPGSDHHVAPIFQVLPMTWKSSWVLQEFMPLTNSLSIFHRSQPYAKLRQIFSKASDFYVLMDQAGEIAFQFFCFSQAQRVMKSWSGPKALQPYLGDEEDYAGLNSMCLANPSYRRGLQIEWLDDLLSILKFSQVDKPLSWQISNFLTAYREKYTGGRIRLARAAASSLLSSSMHKDYIRLISIIDQISEEYHQRFTLPYNQRSDKILNLSKTAPLVTSLLLELTGHYPIRAFRALKQTLSPSPKSIATSSH